MIEGTRPRGPRYRWARREQFTQIDEPYSDTFLLGDFTLELDLGGAVDRAGWMLLGCLAAGALMAGGHPAGGHPAAAQPQHEEHDSFMAT